MIRTLSLAALLAALLLTAGCNTVSRLNPFDGDGEAEQLKPKPLPDFEEEVNLRRVWSTEIGKGTGNKRFRLVPAVVDGVVYSADAWGTVVAHRLADGERVWRVTLDPPVERGWFGGGRDDGSFLSGGVSVDADQVYVGTIEGEVVALSRADGSERWRNTVSSEVLAPVTPTGERLLVTTIDGVLASLDRGTGEQIWSFSTNVPVLTLRGTSPPAVDGPIAIGGFANGRIVALGVLDGVPRWEHLLSQSEGRSELDRLRDIDAAPMIAGGALYISGHKGPTRRIRLQDGNPEWEADVASNQRLASGFGNLYVVDVDGRVVALGANSGDYVWDSDLLLRRGLTGATPIDAYVAVGDQDGYVHLFAQADGRIVGRTEADGKGLDIPPVVAEDRLVVLGRSGRLNVYRLEGEN